MAITSGFFNSINSDRLYNANQMNEPYKHLISNGVVPNPATSFQVNAGSGMNLLVSMGFALIGDGWISTDAVETKTLDPAETLLNRYDLIILKWDNTETVRDGSIEIIKGTPASTPLVPTLTNDDNVSELCLAKIYVGAGVTEITSANITDTRGDSSVCGYTTNLIRNNSGVSSFTMTLSASAWTINTGDGYYYQDVNIDGMSSNMTIIVSGQYDVICSQQSTDKLTFRCSKNVDTIVDVINMGVIS